MEEIQYESIEAIFYEVDWTTYTGRILSITLSQYINYRGIYFDGYYSDCHCEEISDEILQGECKEKNTL